MRWRISSDVVDQIVIEATRFPARECCGLLLGSPGIVSARKSCRNVAADPAVTFEIDPQQLIDAHRAARGGGLAVVGCYHSHPGGRAAPSATDAAMAAADGGLWLIVGGDDLALWNAVDAGALHRRFDPVEFDRVPHDLIVGN